MLLLASVGCESDVDSGAAGKGLDDQVCTQADVGPNFNHQTAGGFTPANLASLVEGDGLSEQALRAGGMRQGHFVYWKEVVEKPPFQPPIDVVCQVIEFDSEADASAYAARLQADPSILRGTVIGLLPRYAEVTTKRAPAQGSNGFVMEMTGESEAGPLAVRVSVVTAGRFVRLVLAGSEGEAPLSELPEQLATSVSQRLQETTKGP